MQIGLQVPSFTWPGGAAAIAPKLAEIARCVDEGGFASLWVMDHFFQIGVIGPAEHDMMESYSTLSYLAGLTKNVRLGTMVTGAIYRYPGILVKTATTLDVLSGGRAYLGIGAGWFDREAQGLGVPFPSTKERFEWLEETLQIAKQMWSDNNGAYQGKHYQLVETL
jgi:alkanesulfonate monooxygenase SsuD/methylene tetrahydromethanopterin reductase-like flavin-dependent oxidoreductase (luciferase family)